MAKGRKREEEGSTKFENFEDKRNFLGKTKSIFDNFLKFYFDGKNRNSEHKP